MASIELDPRLGHQREKKSKAAKERTINLKPKEEVLKRFRWQFHDSILSNWLRFEERYKIGDTVWDFAIFDQKSGKLEMLVMIDWNGDDNLAVQDENTPIEFIYQTDFIGCFKHMLIRLVGDYDDMVLSVFMQCRENGFPYKSYSNVELIDDMKHLIRLSDRTSISTRSAEGDKIINHFHKSIWAAHTRGSVSPLEAWDDDDAMLRVIENRLLYKNIINPNKILQGYNISKVAGKVTVFSAGRAKLIIDKYLSEFDVVFDPFSGFSGRMLGAFAAGKQYYGQDLSATHVEESNRIIEFINQCKNHWPDKPLPAVKQADVFESSGEYPCLFTCSPYADKETWSDVDPVNHTCDEWIEICMERFNCKRYVFVVDTTDKFKDNVVEDIINASHFNTNVEKVLVIDR